MSRHQKSSSFYDINIIADVRINVNILDEQTKKEQSFGRNENYTRKWQYKKEQALKMADKMYCAGYERRAERMAECSDIVQLQYCHDCDSYQVKRANLCRDKLCPICAWRLSLRRMLSMMTIIDNYTPRGQYYLITLTVRNCFPDELSDTMSKMYKVYNRIMQRRTIKPRIYAWVKAVEYTYNASDNTIHPHYHILMDSDLSVATDIIKHWTSDKEIDAEPQAQNISICKSNNAINSICDRDSIIKAALEVSKYICKSSDLLAMPIQTLKSVAEQLNGKRMTSLGGEWKKIAHRLSIDMDSIGDGNSPTCRRCGNANLDNVIMRWAFGEYKLS